MVIKLWAFGSKNNKTLNLDQIYILVVQKAIVKNLTNHIKEHNTVITDGWASYQFLNDPNCNYKHETHIHGPSGNFGFGLHSTNITEGVWGTDKQYIKKIYNYIPDENFVLFLREGEFRYNIGSLNNPEKERKIIEIFKYLFESSNYDLYDDEKLNDNDNNDF